MITYFDTSSMVKWLFEETDSELAADARDKAAFAVTSLMAYPEVLSAIRRANQEGRCSESEMAFAIEEFMEVWNDMAWIPPFKKLIFGTQLLIFDHDLRGYDAVHLASALAFKREAETEVLFSCFDRKLNQAAKAKGLHVHEELGGGQME